MSVDLPIGIFDSGVGGLTVLKRLMETLPNENFIYFGDTARVPYGSKSKDTINLFAVEATKFLISHKIKMVVVACNSASSNSIGILKKRFQIPIIGVISPSALSATQCSISGKIGVIGTYATIQSGAYLRMLNSKGLQIFQQACPLFVPLVEEGLLDHPATELIGEEYLAPLKKFDVDTLILGCTHYPILKPLIQKIMGNNILLIDPAIETAKTVKEFMLKTRINSLRKGNGIIKYFVSDYPRNFNKIANIFLGMSIKKVTTINIEEYSNKIMEQKFAQKRSKKR
ncbi:glutamate racemase [Candidatus Dependentiae bacterium]|nr:glutamate racemase [Candidatus Dependentiae bacterium]